MFNGMVRTIRDSVVGTYPSCHVSSRLEERRAKQRAMRQERRRKPDKPDDFVTYEDSGSDEETPQQQEEVLNTSYNLCDYLRSRESGLRDVGICCEVAPLALLTWTLSHHPLQRRSVNVEYTSRYVLTHDMLRETQISLGYINKVFCSKWLSSRQVVFGTKCNKLLVYDVNMRRVDAIPTLSNSRANHPEVQGGLHAIELSPSRSFLATGARNSSDIAVYRLPTLDPVCVGEGGHRDLIMGMCWLDDQFLVSGSKDSRMALWRINEDHMEFPDGGEEACPTFATIHPLSVKEVRTAQRVSLWMQIKSKNHFINKILYRFDLFASTRSLRRSPPSRWTDTFTSSTRRPSSRHSHESCQTARTTWASPTTATAFMPLDAVPIPSSWTPEPFKPLRRSHLDTVVAVYGRLRSKVTCSPLARVWACSYSTTFEPESIWRAVWMPLAQSHSSAAKELW